MFNDWLLGEMRRRKIHQKDLAGYIGIDQCGVSKRLSGITEWSFREVLEVLDYMEVSITEVL